MAKDKKGQGATQNASKKNELKIASGTTKPLPVPGDNPAAEKEAQVKIKSHLDQLREKKAAIEAEEKALKDKAKAAQNEIKAAQDAEKAQKEADRKAAEELKANASKELEEAKAEVEAAQKALEASPLWATLKTWEAKVTELGGVVKATKVPRASRSGGGGRKAANGVTPNMLKVLGVVVDGKPHTASEIAVATGIIKGKRLPEMVAAELLTEMVPDEEHRGRRFVITAKGRDTLTTAGEE